MTLPHEVRVLPGHTDETTIGREWEENPFIRYWRGDAASIDEAVRVGGEDATLIVVARLRRQGQGAGALRRRARGDHRRLEGGAMSFIVDEPIEEYAERHTTSPDPLLAELAAETKATHVRAADADGPRSRGASSSFSSPARARSACSRSARSPATRRSRWRPAMPEDGRIDTLDIEPKHAEVAQRYFDRSPGRPQDQAPPRPGARDDPTSSRASSTSSSSTQTRRTTTRTSRPCCRGLSEGRPDRDRQHALERERTRPARRDDRLIAALNDKLAADDRVAVVQLTVRDGVTLVRRR